MRFARGEVRADEVRAGEVRAGEVRAGEVRAGEVRAAEVRAGEVRAGEVRAGEVRVGEVRAGEVRAGEVRAGEVRAGEVRAGEVRAGEVRAGEVRAGEVRAGEVNRQDVALCISAADHGNGRLNVGPGQSFLFRTAGIWRRPRLAGVLADECGEYLHHGGVVFGGIPGDPLEGVDAADAHVELVRAELLDGLGVAVGYLPLLGQLERAHATG